MRNDEQGLHQVVGMQMQRNYVFKKNTFNINLYILLFNANKNLMSARLHTPIIL